MNSEDQKKADFSEVASGGSSTAPSPPPAAEKKEYFTSGKPWPSRYPASASN